MATTGVIANEGQFEWIDFYYPEVVQSLLDHPNTHKELHRQVRRTRAWIRRGFFLCISSQVQLPKAIVREITLYI
jgi:hypothetical protein